MMEPHPENTLDEEALSARLNSSSTVQNFDGDGITTDQMITLFLK